MTPDTHKVSPDLLKAAGADPSAAPSIGLPSPSAIVRDWKGEARSIIEIVASSRHIFPSVGAIYTPEVIEDLAGAWAPILERHNVDFGRFMIYVVAGGKTLPVLLATLQAAKKDGAAMKAGIVPTVPAAPSPAETAAPVGEGRDPDLDVKPNVPIAGAGPTVDLSGAPVLP